MNYGNSIFSETTSGRNKYIIETKGLILSVMFFLEAAFHLLISDFPSPPAPNPSLPKIKFAGDNAEESSRLAGLPVTYQYIA